MADKSLDEIAQECGTDKSSQAHCYTFVYERFLETQRSRKLKLLEIGVHEGASLRMWQAYLPNAEIHTIDINPACSEHAGERAQVHIGDQTDTTFLDEVIAKSGGDFDVIIDDGSHLVKHQILSLEYLFPHLKVGGHYFVEDIHTSFLPQFRDHQGEYPSFFEYLSNIQKNFNVFCAGEKDKYELADPKVPRPFAGISGNATSLWQKHLFAVHLYTGICALEKCRRYADPS